MKIAFSVTGPDLSRALARLAEQAGMRRITSSEPRLAASTASHEARMARGEQREATDGQS